MGFLQKPYGCIINLFPDLSINNPAAGSGVIVVTVHSAHYGHNQNLMQNCTRLNEYALFVDQIRRYQKEGYSTDKSIDMATKYCIDNNIMKDILLPMQAEVKKMLLTEYDEKKTLNFLREEARKEGHAAGRMDERKKLVRTMLQNGMSPEQIAQMAGLSLQEVLSVRESEADSFVSSI